MPVVFEAETRWMATCSKYLFIAAVTVVASISPGHSDENSIIVPGVAGALIQIVSVCLH